MVVSLSPPVNISVIKVLHDHDLIWGLAWTFCKSQGLGNRDLRIFCSKNVWLNWRWQYRLLMGVFLQLSLVVVLVTPPPFLSSCVIKTVLKRLIVNMTGILRLTGHRNGSYFKFSGFIPLVFPTDIWKVHCIWWQHCDVYLMFILLGFQTNPQPQYLTSCVTTK